MVTLLKSIVKDGGASVTRSRNTKRQSSGAKSRNLGDALLPTAVRRAREKEKVRAQHAILDDAVTTTTRLPAKEKN